MKIILASKSPRRKQLLQRFNLAFEVVDSNLDESSVLKMIDPRNYCSKLASMKADIVSKQFRNELIIGADTIVVLNKTIIEKPKDKSEAFKSLKKLSGSSHSVLTGVCLKSINHNIHQTFIVQTKVEFRNLEDSEINFYIDNYKPYDKAGSYGIQDASSVFVKYINGCYDNVVGLPISKLHKELKKLNINLLEAN